MTDRTYAVKIMALLLVLAVGAASWAKDIRDLSQHFNKPGSDISPWIFVPKSNIKEISTTEGPGLVTIWEAGKVQDVKGILKEPIRLDEYPLAWEFQLSLVQNYDVLALNTLNAAIGLNVAVTFSDPSTWPKDRTQMPPDTHSVQLFVVKLNDLPQYAPNPQAATALVWGRGDLHHTLTGDWGIPAIWTGDGSLNSGPASPEVFFRFVVCANKADAAVQSVPGVFPQTSMALGIKFNASNGWNMRNFDCSKYGRATGIWQIGPIFSCDRWIPEVLCASLPRTRGPQPLRVAGTGPKGSRTKGSTVAVKSPEPQPADPAREYYVNYCVFMRSRPIPFEQLSDDFDILGYMGQWVDQPQGVAMDTYSHPGYMTWTMLNPGMGAGIAPVGGDLFNLDLYPPPWEMEICFIAPSEDVPWNFWMNFQPVTSGGRVLAWHPGVQYVPDEKRHFYLHEFRARQGKSNNRFDVKFVPPVPESILASKPLYMLLQWIDRTHVRVGFKAKPEDSWYLSEIYDCANILNGEEFKGNFMQADWSTTAGYRRTGLGGSPMYKQIMIDYIHYRYGLTVN